MTTDQTWIDLIHKEPLEEVKINPYEDQNGGQMIALWKQRNERWV